jgi:aspartate/glutamate racemase
MTTLAMLHTGPVVIPPLKALAQTHLPGVRVVNLLDDSIVAEIERNGAIPDTVRDRMDHLGRCAVAAGADAVLVTCSSISQLAEPVQAAIGIPVYRIDEAMADEAVLRGPRIGVVATLATTLEPTCALIEERARLAGAAVTIDRALCREAFDLVNAGDGEGHDRVLKAAIEGLVADHDVIVLAQASMARIRDALDVPVPVLTSPELGVARVRENLEAQGLLPG